MNQVVAAARRLRDLARARSRGVRDFLAGREEGASVVEYALPIALLALICIAAMQVLGGGIANFLNKVAEKMNDLVP